MIFLVKILIIFSFSWPNSSIFSHLESISKIFFMKWINFSFSCSALFTVLLISFIWFSEYFLFSLLCNKSLHHSTFTQTFFELHKSIVDYWLESTKVFLLNLFAFLHASDFFCQLINLIQLVIDFWLAINSISGLILHFFSAILIILLIPLILLISTFSNIIFFVWLDWRLVWSAVRRFWLLLCFNKITESLRV